MKNNEKNWLECKKNRPDLNEEKKGKTKAVMLVVW